MLSNKHFITAMLVAPVLAILGYFAVDFAVSEEPETAREGGQYKLAAASNCRYESGLCTLSNGNFELRIQISENQAGDTVLHLKSEFPLEGVRAAWVQDDENGEQPSALSNLDDDRQQWTLPLNKAPSTDAELRLVAKAQGALYYGETTTGFIEYQTSFGKDFR